MSDFDSDAEAPRPTQRRKFADLDQDIDPVESKRVRLSTATTIKQVKENLGAVGNKISKERHWLAIDRFDRGRRLLQKDITKPPSDYAEVRRALDHVVGEFLATSRSQNVENPR